VNIKIEDDGAVLEKCMPKQPTKSSVTKSCIAKGMDGFSAMISLSRNHPLERQ
jgi:hypothetical protein